MKKTAKISLCLFLVLALIMGLCACGDDAPKPAGPKSNSIADRYIYAQELLGAGQYADAAAAFDAVGDYEDAAKLAMYAKAAALGESGQYDAAIDAFNSFGDYKSSADMAAYYGARREQADGDYSSAIKRYNKIILFKDSAQRVEECKQAMYEIADSYAEQGDLYTAWYAFDYIDTKYQYSDSRARADEYLGQLKQGYASAQALEQAGNYEEAIAAYEKLGDYSDCQSRIAACRKQIRLKADYEAAVALQQAGKYEEAIAAFEALGDYKDSKEQIKETNYLKAKSLLEKKDYAGAAAIFITLKGYKDVDTLLSTDENLKAAAATAANYLKAKSLLEKKDYAGAYAIFITLKGYKDVDTLLSTDENLKAAAHEAAIAPFKKVGGYVTYGTYPQTATGNDSTPIEWLVLDYDAKNNKALLISRYGLDCQKYNSSKTSVTWETCSLRTWLNGTFLNKAFSKAEQGAILTTDVDNSKSQGYSKWSTNGGNNTQDKIFLLSYAEAWKYFGSDSARVSTPTKYAKANEGGSYSNRWWLRSPGYSQYYAALVYSDGSRSYLNVDSTRGVRPAFWLDLSGI